MITKYVFMTEEQSMSVFLDVILERILPINTQYIVIAHEGKQDLEKSIPKKLRAWRNNDAYSYQFIIIRDKDSGNCNDIKLQLMDMAVQAGRDDTIVIIAVHELESWFLGDLAAIEEEYGIAHLSQKQQTKKYRSPDAIASPSEEIFKITKHISKIARAKKIARSMDFQNNASASFNHFLKKIDEL